METGGRREEIETRLKGWDTELGMLRVRLGNGPDALHAKYERAFAELFRHKELVRSRWEAIRGVYHPEPAAVRGFEEALAGMEAAYVAAQPMVAEILGSTPRPIA